MRNSKASAVLSFSVFVLFIQFGFPGASTADDSVVQNIDAIMATAYAADGPGAAIIVVKDGEVLFRKGYGMANIELGVEVDPEMVFRLGSITKQFTAAAIMLLKEKGQLSVKDPITRFLPDYPVQGHLITVEHLLTHTSGIVSYTGIPGYMQNEVRDHLSTEELVSRFKDLPMEFAPGDRWRYNNSGYVLLGAIIETTSGMSYADFVQQNIFEPLEMSQSFYGGHQLIPNRVAGYGWQGEAFENARYLSMTQPHAAGSLLSSVDDLAKWDAALSSHEIVSRESYEKMTTPYVLNNGEATTYGYGLMTGDVRGRKTIQHGGGIFGFSTMAVRVPDENLYVTILTNRSGRGPSPGFLAAKVAAAAIGDPFPAWTRQNVDPKVLESYAGVYKINETEQRTLSFEDGKLYTQRTGSGKLEAIPAGETTFYYETSLSYFEMVPGEGDAEPRMLMHQNGAKEAEEAVRVSAVADVRKEIELDPSIYEFYTGVFELAPGFNLTITREGDRLLTQATGQSQVEIFPESRTRFFLRVVDAQLTFVWGSDGTVNEVILHQGGRETHGKRIE